MDFACFVNGIREERQKIQNKRGKKIDFRVCKIKCWQRVITPNVRNRIAKTNTLFLCSTAVINTWWWIQNPRKRIESYIKVKHGQREHFTDFLKALSKAIKVGVTGHEV